MKDKLISMLLLLCMAVPIVAACGVVDTPIGETTTGSVQILETTVHTEDTTLPETSGKTGTTENTDIHGTEETTTAETAQTITLLPTVNPLEAAPDVSYRKLTTLVPYEDGIAVIANRELRYLDIEREELYLACQDPACDHTDTQTCISGIFGYNRTLSTYAQNFVYCEYDGRFYFPRGQKLFSCKSDFTDLVLEYSFGEEGDLSQKRCKNIYFFQFTAYENYIYFVYGDTDVLYRYDVDAKTLEQVYAESRENVYEECRGYYVIADGRLLAEYCCYEDKTLVENYLVLADANGKNAKKLDIFDMEKAQSFVRTAIYHNGIYYGILEGDHYPYIAAFDLETGLLKTIAQPQNVTKNLLAVTDDMIYFSRSDILSEMIWCVPTSGGTPKVALSSFSHHTGHEVYTPSSEQENTDTFFLEDIYFLSKDTVIIGGFDSEYVPMYIADVKDDGTFTNLRKVEMKSDRYVSAEPIERVEITPGEDIPSGHLDDFVEFHYYSDGAIRRTKSLMYDNMYAGNLAIQFRVVGIDHTEDKNATYYHVRILHVYGMEEDEYDTEKIYLLKYNGTPAYPYYDRPPLEFDKDYLIAASRTFDKKPYLSVSQVMSLSYEDGKTYVYSPNYDLCMLLCAEKITNPNENQIFKADKHGKHIASANSRGLGLETYDYKCELYALLAEVWEIE